MSEHLQNPFPESFYPGEEGAPDNIWEPMFTQNTVNGWARDSWEQCKKAHIDAGYLSPEEHAKRVIKLSKKYEARFQKAIDEAVSERESRQKFPHQISIRDIREDVHIPDYAKDLACDLVTRMHMIESQIVGSLELAARRGHDGCKDGYDVMGQELEG